MKKYHIHCSRLNQNSVEDSIYQISTWALLTDVNDIVDVAKQMELEIFLNNKRSYAPVTIVALIIRENKTEDKAIVQLLYNSSTTNSNLSLDRLDYKANYQKVWFDDLYEGYCFRYDYTSEESDEDTSND